MRVKILEEKLRDEDTETGQRYDLRKDDQITVSDKIGQLWCDHGWAEDVDGNYASGQRVVSGVTVQPKKAVHKTTQPRGRKS